MHNSFDVCDFTIFLFVEIWPPHVLLDPHQAQYTTYKNLGMAFDYMHNAKHLSLNPIQCSLSL
jgi:hypothetical protein